MKQEIANDLNADKCQTCAGLNRLIFIVIPSKQTLVIDTLDSVVAGMLLESGGKVGWQCSHICGEGRNQMFFSPVYDDVICNTQVRCNALHFWLRLFTVR